MKITSGNGANIPFINMRYSKTPGIKYNFIGNISPKSPLQNGYLILPIPPVDDGKNIPSTKMPPDGGILVCGPIRPTESVGNTLDIQA